MSLSEEQVQTLHEVISQFRGLQETLPAQFQEIRDTLHLQQQQINSLLNNNPATSTNNIKVRLPSSFDGKSSQCSTFFAQLSVYFIANPTYTTDEKKIMLAVSCVSGPVFSFLEPFISQLGQQDKPDILTNYETFKSSLMNAFGDPDPIVTAETQLRRLRQENMSTSVYATRFRMYAQSVQWNDAALMSQFKVNLSQDIQNELARRPTPTTLELLISEAIDIDNKLIRGPKERRNIRNNYDNQSLSTSAMEIDPKPTQSGQITQEERDRRAQTRSCYYCGDSTHFKRDCPRINSPSVHALTTFVLNSVTTPQEQVHFAKFSDLPSAQVLSENTKSTHIRIPHAQDGLLHVPIIFGTSKPGQFKRIQALLDTGASMSIVSQDLVDSLYLQSDTTRVSTPFIVGNNQSTVSSSTLTTKIRISNSIFHSESHKFYVVRDCSFQVILGLDWIRKHGVSIDFDNKVTEIKCDDTLACCPVKSVPHEYVTSTSGSLSCTSSIASSSSTQAIQEFKPCLNAQEIQVFLGLTNVYRPFIKNYSMICTPLTALLKKDITFEWSLTADQAFKYLKATILSVSVLPHFVPPRPCIVSTDVSTYALGFVCSQADSTGLAHPIVFFSRQLSPAEQNYQVYDKELLAITTAFKHCRPYLKSSREPTIVLSDNKNLQNFSTARNLSHRQARWSTILSDYNFVIQFRSVKQHTAVDALSRSDKPVKEGGEAPIKTAMTLFAPTKYSLNTMIHVTSQFKPTVIQDKSIQNIFDLLFKLMFYLFALFQEAISVKGVTFTTKFGQALLKNFDFKSFV